MFMLAIIYWMLGIESSYSIDDIRENFNLIHSLKAYLIGSLTLATVSALASGMLGYFVLIILNKKKAHRHGESIL